MSAKSSKSPKDLPKPPKASEKGSPKSFSPKSPKSPKTSPKTSPRAGRARPQTKSGKKPKSKSRSRSKTKPVPETDTSEDPFAELEAGAPDDTERDEHARSPTSFEEIVEDPAIVVPLLLSRVVPPIENEKTITEYHREIIVRFITDPTIRLLVLFTDPHTGFIVDNSVPAYFIDHLSYFIKEDIGEVVTTANFSQTIQYGTVKAKHIDSLLRLMTGIYAPAFFENVTWPESILLFSSYMLTDLV